MSAYTCCFGRADAVADDAVVAAATRHKAVSTFMVKQRN